MMFLVTLVVTAAAVLLLRPAMRKAPWVFYLLALAVDVTLIVSLADIVALNINPFLLIILRRGFLALSLFVIVMYIGVFPYGSKLRNYLAPVRAVLSIIACILALGHVCCYVGAYVTKLMWGELGASVSAAIIAGLLLLVLLVVLGVTSFGVVRRKMNARTWIKLQKFAYAFYALIFLHAMFLLVPSALQGGEAALISVVVYGIIFLVYLCARIWRAYKDGKSVREAHEFKQEELDAQAV